jgi:hypothetical protein
MSFNLKKDVTLICVDGIDPDLSLKALNFSNSQINFENAKLLSVNKPKGDLGVVSHTYIDPMNWNGYNDFMAKKLKNYIETPFCLTIQTDGFITSPHLWNDEFFQYDYIGAPWPDEDVWLNLQYEETRNSYIENQKKCRIGNGGFSLRSKKFLDESSRYESCMGYGEDAFLCNMKYDEMLKSGIKFPSVDIAIKFSIENPISELGYNWPELDHNFNSTRAFGFHGKYICDYPEIIEKMSNYEK